MAATFSVSPMYVVTPFINKQQGRELELSILGWNKFFKTPFTRIVIGDWHPCLAEHPEVQFIPQVRATDTLGGQYLPHIDHAEKFLTICNRLPEHTRFIRVADDCFPVKPFTVEDIDHNYIHGTQLEGIKYSPNGFKVDQWKTRRRLDRDGYPHLNYTIHSPMIYDSTLLRSLIVNHDLTNESFVIEDLYFNIHQPKEKPIILNNETDSIRGILNHIDPFQDMSEVIRKIAEQKLWFFTTNSGYTSSVEKSLLHHYNTASN